MQQSRNTSLAVLFFKTRVKMISKEGTTLAEKSKAELEKKIGIFHSPFFSLARSFA